jgi:hypothetical protein
MTLCRPVDRHAASDSGPQRSWGEPGHRSAR